MLTISKKDVTGNLGPDNRPAAYFVKAVIRFFS